MVDLSQKKWIIFDLDGTIVKLPVDWSACRKEVRQRIIKKYPNLRLVFEEKELELKRQGRKLTVETMGLVAYNVLGNDIYIDFQDIQERYETLYNAEDLKPCKEIVEFIKKNRDKFKFAVCSNNSFSGVNFALKKIEILETIHIVESRKIGRPPKPSPDIMRDILNSVDTTIKGCLMVGDNDATDRALAQSVDMEYMDYNSFISKI